jgi:hypothetical protein
MDAALLPYALVQEDGPVEWATFLAFVAAAGLWARRARRVTGARATAASLVVALFCVFVAGEEISWGQRLLGLRAPAFFLAGNAQQETNLHNLASNRAREAAMALVLGACIVGLPRTFAPAAAAVLALHLLYPLPFTGELVELALGMLLLLAALPRPVAWTAALVRAGAVGALVVVLSLVATRAAVARRGDPAVVARTRRETLLLAKDFVATARSRGEAPTRCDTHVRLFRLASAGDMPELWRGRFATHAATPGERERRQYFLDPWDQSYWVRHACDDNGRESAFLYSFGPNRRRDSGPFRLGGDDVGTYLLRAATGAPAP